MNQADIYEFLVANGPSTVREIAEGLTVCSATGKSNIRSRLAQLEKWDKVRVVGTVEANPGNRACVWEAVCP